MSRVPSCTAACAHLLHLAIIVTCTSGVCIALPLLEYVDPDVLNSIYQTHLHEKGHQSWETNCNNRTRYNLC
ncbi:hypothetical protein EV426DRAFT_602025 [Tirmania nivea]|nr:hypothetical protein EV426DRAFT_602025 [Tirmania nivea]